MTSPTASPNPLFEKPPVACSGVTVASLRRRGVAYVLDGFIAGFSSLVLVIVVLLIGAAASGGSFSIGGDVSSDSSATELLEISGLFLLWYLPPVVLIGLLPLRSGAGRGRTIGKRALDIQVISADGTELTRSGGLVRAAVFFAPQIVAVVVGPLLDAVAGTPPVFTFVFLWIALLIQLADQVAPLIGDLRRTVHDRVAGTVVVDCRTVPAFDPNAAGGAPVVTPPLGRSKTAGTWWLLGGLVSLVVIILLVFTIAAMSSSSDSGSVSDQAVAQVVDPSASSSTGSVPTGAGALTITLPPYSTPMVAVGASSSTRDAQRAAMRIGATFLSCLIRTKASEDCASDIQIGLPSIDVSTATSIGPHDPSEVGRILRSEGELLGKNRATIGVVGADGTFWGVGISSSFDLAPFCVSPAGEHGCSDTPEGAEFTSKKVAQRIVDAGEALRWSPKTGLWSPR